MTKVYIINKSIFEARSKSGCSNSDYNLVRTTCCGKFAVEDDELLDLYYDSENLSKIVKLYEDSNCPFCNSNEWDYVEIEDASLVPNHWKWAICKL